MVDTLAKEMHADEHTTGRVKPDTQFERDLGFDSLTRAELLGRIEQTFHMHFPVDTFASATTSTDLVRALQTADAAPVAVGKH